MDLIDKCVFGDGVLQNHLLSFHILSNGLASVGRHHHEWDRRTAFMLSKKSTTYHQSITLMITKGGGAGKPLKKLHIVLPNVAWFLRSCTWGVVLLTHLTLSGASILSPSHPNIFQNMFLESRTLIVTELVSICLLKLKVVAMQRCGTLPYICRLFIFFNCFTHRTTPLSPYF